MVDQKTKDEARALRRNGESIKRISVLISKNASTVSYWCRDIILTRAQIQKLLKRQEEGAFKGQLLAAERKRAVRIETIKLFEKQGAKDIKTFTQRDLFMLGLGLYWGEGFKNANGECGIANSDPDVILAFIRWVKVTYGIRVEHLILRVSVNHIHRERIQEIERHWSQVTGVPISQFTKSSFIYAASKKVFLNPESHFGTLRIKVRRATNLRRRIMGSLHELRKSVSV